MGLSVLIWAKHFRFGGVGLSLEVQILLLLVGETKVLRDTTRVLASMTVISSCMFSTLLCLYRMFHESLV